MIHFSQFVLELSVFFTMYYLLGFAFLLLCGSVTHKEVLIMPYAEVDLSSPKKFRLVDTGRLLLMWW